MWFCCDAVTLDVFISDTENDIQKYVSKSRSWFQACSHIAYMLTYCNFWGCDESYFLCWPISMSEIIFGE